MSQFLENKGVKWIITLASYIYFSRKVPWNCTSRSPNSLPFAGHRSLQSEEKGRVQWYLTVGFALSLFCTLDIVSIVKYTNTLWCLVPRYIYIVRRKTDSDFDILDIVGMAHHIIYIVKMILFLQNDHLLFTNEPIQFPVFRGAVCVRMVGGLGGEVNIPRASRLPVEGNNTSSHHQPSSWRWMFLIKSYQDEWRDHFSAHWALQLHAPGESFLAVPLSHSGMRSWFICAPIRVPRQKNCTANDKL